MRVEAALFYHIELVGRERLGNNDVYHLKLTAYRDRDTRPLTDLYVDPETFLVREAAAKFRATTLWRAAALQASSTSAASATTGSSSTNTSMLLQTRYSCMLE